MIIVLLVTIIFIILFPASKPLKSDVFWNKSFCILYIIAFIYLFTIGEVNSEFRFCYKGKGPHKIREMACPGGFIAFTPINVSCMYYVKGPDISDLSVQFDADMCDVNSQLIEVDTTKISEIHGSKFQKILFEFEDEFAEATAGAEMSDELCAVDCLDDWVNPLEPEDEPMLKEKPTISDEEKTKYEKEYSARSEKLFIALMRDDARNLLRDQEDTLVDFRYIIRLLAKSMRITMIQCAPYVESAFYEQVLKGMIYIYETNQSNNHYDIDVIEFRQIYKHLDSCEKRSNSHYVINSTSCDKKQTVDTIINLSFDSGGSWKYRRQSRSFRWGVYDPLIEAAWVAVDFVHGFCMETFYSANDLLHFHLFIEVIEALFPFDPVQKHWMYPVPLRNDEFWNIILDTEDIKNQMRNLDACAIAAYFKPPYQERLLRPFVKLEQIENPQYVADDVDGKGKGWKKTVAEYWSWYEKHGSFKELSKSFGYCLDGSKEDLEAAIEDMEQNGLNCQR